MEIKKDEMKKYFEELIDKRSREEAEANMILGIAFAQAFDILSNDDYFMDEHEKTSEYLECKGLYEDGMWC